MKNQDNLLISIIVPVYNIESFLHRCMASILNQTYPHLDIILVDDGSLDNCGKICDEYAEKDSRVTVLHKENGGVTSARRLGVKHSKGKYIMFADGDDVISQDCVESLLNPLADKSYDIVLGSLESVPPILKLHVPTEGLVSATDYLEYLLTGKVIWGVYCKIFKRILFEKEDPFAPDFIKLGEDAVMNVRIALEAKEIYFIDKIIYSYYLHSNSATSTLPVKFNESIVLLENMLKPIEEKGRVNEFKDSISSMKFKWWIHQIYNCQSLPFPNRYIVRLLKYVRESNTLLSGKGMENLIYKTLSWNLYIALFISYLVHGKVRLSKFYSYKFKSIFSF